MELVAIAMFLIMIVVFSYAIADVLRVLGDINATLREIAHHTKLTRRERHKIPDSYED